ncbi:MAG: hypothetical protein AAGJ97_05610, partial [Planctomycetota bacterium]
MEDSLDATSAASHVATFERAIYRGRVTESAVVGRVTWTFPQGCDRVVTDFRGIVFEKFRREDGESSDVFGGVDVDGRLVLWAPRGDRDERLTVSADWAAPLADVGSGRRLSVVLPGSGISQVELRGRLAEVRAGGGAVIAGKTDGRVVVEAGGRSNLDLEFFEPLPQAVRTTLTVSGTLSTVASDLGLGHSATLRVAAFGGTVDVLRFPIAIGDEVTRVEADGYPVPFVRKNDTVEVGLDEPLSEAGRAITVVTTSGADVASRHRFPLMIPDGALPTALTYSLTLNDGWDLRGIVTNGVAAETSERLDAETMTLGYDVVRADASVDIDLVERDSRPTATATHYLADPSWPKLCESVFAISSGGGTRYQVAATLPPGWDLLSVHVREDSDRPKSPAWRQAPYTVNTAEDGQRRV